MSGDNLTKKTQVANLTNVTLAPEHDMGPPRNNVIFSCNFCDKSYDKKTSYQSHMRLKHKPTKESEVEKGAKTPQKKSGQGVWIENECDRPLLLTRELDSFLDNRSNASLIGAAREIEEAEMQVEKMVVRNHEFEWFEEDNGVEFNQEFSSDFASSLRRDSLPSQPASNLVEFHNDLMKKQVDKYDAMVVRTTRMLKHAELTKKELRKRVELLEKELQETQENWQGSSEADSEEIAGLKSKIVTQNIRIDELELAAKEPQEKIGLKCGKCSFATSSKESLSKHMKSTHLVKQGKKCPQCPQVSANEKLFRMHIKSHQLGTQYQCDICQKTFNSLNDARSHSRKACGNITQKEVVIDIEDVEETHRCNACSTSYNSNTELERHMDKHHAVDCTRCHETFKSQDDIYKHANVCSEIIEPLMCEKCNRELISKAGLKKHMERCKGDERPSTGPASSNKSKQQQSKEKCTNGPKCRFLKENRCLFGHKEHNNKHFGNEHRNTPEWKCHACSEKFANKNEKHSHKCQQHDYNTVEERRKNTECKRGPSCFRLAQGSCWFKHSPVQNTRGQQGVDSRPSHRGVDSRPSRQGVDSRPSRQGDNLRPCKFGARCDRILTCGFLHLAKDFLTSQGGRRN